MSQQALCCFIRGRLDSLALCACCLFLKDLVIVLGFFLGVLFDVGAAHYGIAQFGTHGANDVCMRGAVTAHDIKNGT